MIRGKSRHLGDELMRYAIAGGISAAVEFGGFALAYHLFGLATVPATVAGHGVSILVNYLLNAFWVFRHRRVTRVALELPTFIAIALVGMAINIGVMVGLESGLALTGVVAKVPASACVALWAFTAKRLLLFPVPKPEPDQP